jgi:hypothetical protein
MDEEVLKVAASVVPAASRLKHMFSENSSATDRADLLLLRRRMPSVYLSNYLILTP